MGWNSGIELADNLWGKIEDVIPEDKKPEVARAFIKEFEKYDCDCMEETELYKWANRYLDVTEEDNKIKIAMDELYANMLKEFLGCLDQNEIWRILDAYELEDAKETYDLTYKLYALLNIALRRKPNV